MGGNSLRVFILTTWFQQQIFNNWECIYTLKTTLKYGTPETFYIDLSIADKMKP